MWHLPSWYGFTQTVIVCSKYLSIFVQKSHAITSDPSVRGGISAAEISTVAPCIMNQFKSIILLQGSESENCATCATCNVIHNIALRLLTLHILCMIQQLFGECGYIYPSARAMHLTVFHQQFDPWTMQYLHEYESIGISQFGLVWMEWDSIILLG